MLPAPYRPFVFLLLAGMIGAIPLLAQENQEWRFHHGQVQVPIKNWAAPLYFRPSEEESAVMKRTWEASATTEVGNLSPAVNASSSIDPSVPLVFVATTPCRVMDTRAGQGQTGAFGPPAVAGGTSRTVPIPTSPTCSVPTTALAYSFNVTVVPHGPLGYLTIWPDGQTQPVVSTLNSYTGTVVANAAIVPAGTNGSVDVYVTDTTDVILDINGYYVPQTVLALGAGTVSAPSLTFSNDTNSGLYSPSAGTVDITSKGNNILTVNSSGINVTGSVSSTGVISGNGSGLTNVSASNVASGTTLRGSYAVAFTAAAGGDRSTSAISFGFTLPSAPVANFIAAGGASTTACPGTSANPQAARGQLCVYETSSTNVSADRCIAKTGSGYVCNAADPYGTSVWLTSTAAGATVSVGSWAVTVP